LKRLLFLLIFIAFLPGCKSHVEPEKEKAKPATVQEETPVVEEEVQPQEDRGPDGGLGTLDYSRDAKAISDEQSKQAEKALEETE